MTGEDKKSHAYISLNGKLKKTKCEFIKDNALAEKLVGYFESRLKKLIQVLP